MWEGISEYMSVGRYLYISTCGMNPLKAECSKKV